MLKRLTAEDLPLIRKLCKDSVIGTRIYCYALSYGFDKDFLDFYSDGVNIVSRFENVFNIKENGDNYPELKELIEFLGVDTVVSSEKFAEYCAYPGTDIKYAYELKQTNGVESDVISEEINSENLRECYSLISKEIPGSFRDDKHSYLTFASDFLYRKSRGYARGNCIKDDGHVIATALSSFETELSALLSGISCSSEHRGCGIGKKIVLSLSDTLINEGKTVYVIALNDKARGFYEHTGFSFKEKIAYTERQGNV